MYLQKNPGINITKYQIAELTAKPYIGALSTENLQSAFRKTGVYPFDKHVISSSQVAPSVIYKSSTNEAEPTVDAHVPVLDQSISQITEQSITDTAEILDQPYIAEPIETESHQKSPVESFFDDKKIVAVASKKGKRKFNPPFLAGSLMKEKNQKLMQASESKQAAKTKQNDTSYKESKQCSLGKAKKPKVFGKTKKEIVQDEIKSKQSTSGTSKKGGPIEIMEDTDDSQSQDDDVKPEELCCVCGKWQPEELRGVVGLVITKWGQCDACLHWTHLAFCTPVRVIRLHDVFLCPHCEDKNVD